MGNNVLIQFKIDEKMNNRLNEIMIEQEKNHDKNYFRKTEFYRDFLRYAIRCFNKNVQ